MEKFSGEGHGNEAVRSKPTLAEMAYRKIRQQIMEYKLPPGMVVSERLLSESLGLSKAPIRSALIRLASDGLVSIASRQGIVITTPTLQDIIELFQLRVPLEVLCVRSIAGRLDDQQIARLNANLELYRSAAVSPPDSVNLDFDFHRLLCDFHGSRQLSRVLYHVYDALYREVRLAQMKYPTRVWSSLAEHEAVAAAVIAGDADKAENLLVEHLRFGERFVLSRGSSVTGEDGRSR
jgi:DNA-binding GntR family transcriptional regulator